MPMPLRVVRTGECPGPMREGTSPVGNSEVIMRTNLARFVLGTTMMAASVVAAPALASAQSVTTNSGISQTNTPNGPSSVTNPTPTAPSVLPTASTSSLPFTGADVAELAVVAAGAMGAGGILVLRAKKAAATPR